MMSTRFMLVAATAIAALTSAQVPRGGPYGLAQTPPMGYVRPHSIAPIDHLGFIVWCRDFNCSTDGWVIAPQHTRVGQSHRRATMLFMPKCVRMWLF